MVAIPPCRHPLQPIAPFKLPPKDPKDEKGFIWVSQEIRQFHWSLMDSVEKEKTIPNWVFDRDPKCVYDFLKEWDRLDLLSLSQITPALQEKYPEFKELAIKRMADANLNEEVSESQKDDE